MRKSESDGQAARPFLTQRVGLDPGQRFDQSGFAMIDMTYEPYIDLRLGR